MTRLRFLREPLVWFFAVSGVLFAVARRTERDDSVLHIRRSSLAALVQAEARRRHVSDLTPDESAAVRSQAIDDELLYREGVRLGVDKNDAIVRQRVIQKMLLLAADLRGVARPVTDAELTQYLATHAAQYARPAQVSFVHVFSAASAAPLAALRPTLEPGTEGDAATPPSAGDAFPLGRRVVDAPLPAVAQNYGRSFSDAVAGLPIGVWSEPLLSRYGYHLVKVIARRDGGAPALAEVRDQVRLDLAQESKARATRELLRSVRDRYTVIIDDRDDGIALSGGAAAALEAD